MILILTRVNMHSMQFSPQSFLTLATPWTAVHQAFLSITNSWSFLKLMSIDLIYSFSLLCTFQWIYHNNLFIILYVDISIDFIFCYYEQCSFYRSPGIHGQELRLDKPLGLELLDPEYMFSHFIRQCHIVFPKIVLIFVGCTICKNFLPFYGLSFRFVYGFLCWAKAFEFN